MIYEEEDVVGMATMEEGLEVPLISQVGPGLCILQTLMDEGTHMEEPRDEVSIHITTCVSLELLEDGPYAGMGKGSLPMRWKTLPWMTTMRPCVLEKQGTLIVAELVGVSCDLMEKGENSHDKGGT